MQSFSYSIDHHDLVDIKTLINTPPLARMSELDGMFFRGEDFSQSYANLTQQYMDEFKIANEAFPSSKDVHELHSFVAHKTRPHSTGDNHFTTYTLSPYLRHYINDSCRLLEPTTPQFVRQHSQLAYLRNRSLGTYIKELKAANVVMPFDSIFIIELYETWNDYKHRSTKGLHAGAWSYQDNIVIEPKLGLPQSSFVYEKLDKLTVMEFVQTTNKTILAYLKYTFNGVTEQ